VWNYKYTTSPICLHDTIKHRNNIFFFTHEVKEQTGTIKNKVLQVEFIKLTFLLNRLSGYKSSVVNVIAVYYPTV
jgi:hypothetical protein